MKFINITLRAEVEDELYGRVEDEVWEKYQNGEISTWDLYEKYFYEYDRTNLDYITTDIEEVEEDRK